MIRRLVRLAILVAAFIAGGAFYMRYMSPFVTDGRATGHIVAIERRGTVFPTVEGEFVTDAALSDANALYERSMTFSTPADSIADRLLEASRSGKTVEISYQQFYGTLPWRGASKTIVTGVRTLK